jgi:DNA-binding NarL/FixJ family response regulator
MPGVDGFGGLLRLRADFPETPVVVISALEDRRLVKEAIALGAAGFIPKSTPRHEIVGALHCIAAGEVYAPADVELAATASVLSAELDIAQRMATLTAQQALVLQLLGTGKLNREIADELDVAEQTVKNHVSAVLQKLKVHSRTQAVILTNRLLSGEQLRDADTARDPPVEAPTDEERKEGPCKMRAQRDQ